jgi:hypothetical protein
MLQLNFMIAGIHFVSFCHFIDTPQWLTLHVYPLAFEFSGWQETKFFDGLLE